MYVMCENVTISQTSIFPALHLPIDAKKKKEKKTETSVYCLQIHEIAFVATVIVSTIACPQP